MAFFTKKVSENVEPTYDVISAGTRGEEIRKNKCSIGYQAFVDGKFIGFRTDLNDVHELIERFLSEKTEETI